MVTSGQYQRKHRTGLLPPIVRNRPSLDPSDEWYLSAFYALSTCRSDTFAPEYGMVYGRIPWTAIRQYAREYGLDSYDAHVFDFVMRTLDDVWLRDIEASRPRKRSSSLPGLRSRAKNQ